MFWVWRLAIFSSDSLYSIWDVQTYTTVILYHDIIILQNNNNHLGWKWHSVYIFERLGITWALPRTNPDEPWRFQQRFTRILLSFCKGRQQAPLQDFRSMWIGWYLEISKGVSPVIIHFFMGFSIKASSSWGTPIVGNLHLMFVWNEWSPWNKIPVISVASSCGGVRSKYLKISCQLHRGTHKIANKLLQI